MKVKALIEKLTKLATLSPTADIGILSPEQGAVLNPDSVKLEIVLDDKDEPVGIVTITTTTVV